MLSTRSLPFALAGPIFSVLSGQAVANINISDPDAVDAVLDRYADGERGPSTYARLEDWDGNIVYENTHFSVDPKSEIVGVRMSHLFWIPNDGVGRDGAFRGELYRQFWADGST